MAARECYVAKLEIDDHLYALNIEEKRLTVDLVSLDDDILSQTTCIHKSRPFNSQVAYLLPK